MVQQPSVSATGHGIEECATLICDIMNEAGISSRILRVDGHAPIIYGDVSSEIHPDRTILFYNHYDVQPAEPLDLWHYEPFGGQISDGRIYGRGATDDKGELAARIEAVRSMIHSDTLPCNVKFVVEGEEENGSTGIPLYLKEYAELFACDGIVWEFGYVDTSDRPVVGLGMKGMLYVELEVSTASRDMHSGMAPLIPNAAWRLVGALSTLAADDGRILIPDWYEGVVSLSDEEKAILYDMPYDIDTLLQDAGLDTLVLSQNAQQAKDDLALIGTCNIAGMWSGYTDGGTKTILPCKAWAKLDLRLVPDMIPQLQVERLRDHLQKHGYGDVAVHTLHAERGIRVSASHPFVQVVQDAANQIYGSHVLNLIYPETGPIWHLSTALEAPCVLVGGTHINSRIHAPDEYARIDLLHKTAQTMVAILERFSV